MADPATDRDRHDGRFGKRFDDEVSVKGVVWTTIWLAVVCVLGMWITWEMRDLYSARAEAARPHLPPIPGADEQRMPDVPRLQNDPEGELEALKHEMSERLGGYGWVNEGAGVVHIPIEQAMDLLLAQGASPGVEAAPEATPEEAGE